MLPGVLACILSLILSHAEAADSKLRDRKKFISHPYAFQLFAYMLGFLIVFRTNFAYQRYWEAMGALQAMGAKWIDGVCMGIVFDAGRSDDHLLNGMFDIHSLRSHETTKVKGGPAHSEYAQDLCHLCSLMHALALMHLRGDQDLNNIKAAKDSRGAFIEMRGTWTQSFSDKATVEIQDLGIPRFDDEHLQKVFKRQRLRVLGGLSDNERKALEMNCHGKPFCSEARVSMVESWFMRRLIARQKFEQGESAATSPPILSRLYQVISDGTLNFASASKISNTPFPFPYHNLIGILLWTYTFCAPFLINGCILEVGARAILSFLVVFVYHSLAAVGDNLEDPYTPYDPNELPLQEIQASINTRLLCFGTVPGDTLQRIVSDSTHCTSTDSRRFQEQNGTSSDKCLRLGPPVEEALSAMVQVEPRDAPATQAVPKVVVADRPCMAQTTVVEKTPSVEQRGGKQYNTI